MLQNPPQGSLCMGNMHNCGPTGSCIWFSAQETYIRTSLNVTDGHEFSLRIVAQACSSALVSMKIACMALCIGFIKQFEEAVLWSFD